MKQYKDRNSSLAYEVIGEGIPIVFFHGWGMDHQIMSGCMEPVFQELHGFRRIYIDLPGMGQSVAGPEIHNSDDVLAVLYSFLSMELEDERFILMGESYGGYLARGFLHLHPEMVKAMILLCPLVIPGYRTGRAEPLVVKAKDEEFLATLSEAERSQFQYMNVILTRPVWEAYCRDIMSGYELRNQHFLECVLDGSCTFDVDEVERPYELPVLILTGKGDTEVGYKDQFELLSIYKNASYHVINNAGHNMQIEQPEIFAASISSWLKSL